MYESWLTHSAETSGNTRKRTFVPAPATITKTIECVLCPLNYNSFTLGGPSNLPAFARGCGSSSSGSRPRSSCPRRRGSSVGRMAWLGGSEASSLRQRSRQSRDVSRPTLRRAVRRCTAVPAQGVHAMRLAHTFFVPPTRIPCSHRNLPHVKTRPLAKGGFWAHACFGH
jgi:hypothetical protein